MFDLGVSWLPNAEILKQSSEVAILKTYDLKFTDFTDSTIHDLGLHLPLVHTPFIQKIYTYCLCFIDGDFYTILPFRKSKKRFIYCGLQ